VNTLLVLRARSEGDDRKAEVILFRICHEVQNTSLMMIVEAICEPATRFRLHIV
jgi:hypothetical protein